MHKGARGTSGLLSDPARLPIPEGGIDGQWRHCQKKSGSRSVPSRSHPGWLEAIPVTLRSSAVNIS
eukprot:scaffold39095_cov48-Attheya_sp.AAC.4